MAPRWYTQTICHAWATCPQRGQEVVSADHSIVIPRKKCPHPPKKKSNVGELLLASQHYIYICNIYIHMYIYYLLGSFNPNWKEYARQIGSSPHGKNVKTCRKPPPREAFRPSVPQFPFPLPRSQWTCLSFDLVGLNTPSQSEDYSWRPNLLLLDVLWRWGVYMTVCPISKIWLGKARVKYAWFFQSFLNSYRVS